MVNGFSSPDGLQASGIHVDGKKYFTLQANERSIYGKQGVSVKGLNSHPDSLFWLELTEEGSWTMTRIPRDKTSFKEILSLSLSLFSTSVIRDQLKCLPLHHCFLSPFSQADGLVIVKTNQAVLVCQYSSPIVPGEATKVVESLADYLIGTGY